MLAPPRWSTEQLNELRAGAVERFRQQRMGEPLDEYLAAFDECQGLLEDLLERTVDLSQLNDEFTAVILEVTTAPGLLEALRVLSGPPVSADDLKILAEASLSPSRLRSDPQKARDVIHVVKLGLDRRRFSWVGENREPTESEREAAILASSALMATRRVDTSRRHAGKSEQEQLVHEALLSAGFQNVLTRTVNTLSAAPGPGEFCRESLLGTRKADFIVGLWDHRTLAVECKVSNSATNSVKRLNNDAAVKAGTWLQEFGNRQVVPAALLSGVYKARNLLDAQSRGLALFWAHDLPAFLDWIERTRE